MITIYVLVIRVIVSDSPRQQKNQGKVLQQHSAILDYSKKVRPTLLARQTKKLLLEMQRPRKAATTAMVWQQKPVTVISHIMECSLYWVPGTWKDAGAMN